MSNLNLIKNGKRNSRHLSRYSINSEEYIVILKERVIKKKSKPQCREAKEGAKKNPTKK